MAVSSAEAGRGTTVAAVSLAQALALAGDPILLVDLDPSADATRRIGLSPVNSGLMLRVLRSEETPERLALLVRSAEIGLDVLPADVALQSDFEVDEVRLGRVLGELLLNYRCVILDCPPWDSALTRAVARVVDDVVLVGQDGGALEQPDGSKIIRLLEGEEAALRVEGASSRVFVPRDADIEGLLDRGRSLFDEALDSRAARGFVELAKELMQRGRA